MRFGTAQIARDRLVNRTGGSPRRREAGGGIVPKSPEDIARMRVAGRLASEVLDLVSEHIGPGVTTAALDALCHDHIVNVQRAIPAPLNYHGFPKSVCTSVNHQVCHGIPNEKRLKNGDIVNVDVTVIKDGFHGDTSRMMFVGEPSIAARRLCRIAREAMWIGIEMVRPGIRLGDVGHAIQRHAQKHGCSVVREYCGHGIGRCFHEEPQVLHYGQPGTREVLEEGWTFTIEPMVNAVPAPREAPQGRLDGGDQGSKPVRPMGAHRRGDRIRRRGAHAAAGRHGINPGRPRPPVRL